MQSYKLQHTAQMVTGMYPHLKGFSGYSESAAIREVQENNCQFGCFRYRHTHSLTHKHSLITHSFTHSLTRSLDHSITRSLNHSITQITHSITHSLTQSINQSITQSLNHSITQITQITH